MRVTSLKLLAFLKLPDKLEESDQVYTVEASAALDFEDEGLSQIHEFFFRWAVENLRVQNLIEVGDEWA